MEKKKLEKCGLKDLKKNKKIIQSQVLNFFNQRLSIENNFLQLRMPKLSLKLTKDNVMF
jgi:hypothetical protein